MKHAIVPAIALALLSTATFAQIALPTGSLPRLETPQLPLDIPSTSVALERLGRTLEVARLDRLARFVRQNRDAIEFDESRNPAVRGEILVNGAGDDLVKTAKAEGFTLLERDTIEGLDISFARFGIPKDMSLAQAEGKLQSLFPDADIDADHIYFQSGSNSALPLSTTALASASLNTSLGIIDGGVADHPAVRGRVEQNGFVAGAPSPSSHGTSVAALMVGSGDIKGVRSGSGLLAADVYGTSKTGGNATAIARALGWLATRGVSVVTISLVGPHNELLKNAVAAAQRKGVIIVAAVGNDGPASPPAYPASYPGVLAVTGVDRNNRALPEAGRASHTDFAAPGADIVSATGSKKKRRVRGTSFAAPLVAARLSTYYPRQSNASIEQAVRKLMAEAVDLGKKGHDPVYGHGLVCGKCAR